MIIKFSEPFIPMLQIMDILRHNRLNVHLLHIFYLYVTVPDQEVGFLRVIVFKLMDISSQH